MRPTLPLTGNFCLLGAGEAQSGLYLIWPKLYVKLEQPDLWSVKYTLWGRQWHPTPVLLPGKSHGRRTLVGCSPWGHEESDMTEQIHFHFSLSCIGEGNGNPLQCSCLENPRDGEPGRLPSMGSHRVGLNWTDLAAAAAVHKCYPKAFFFQSVCLFVWLSIGEEALICWQILYLHTVFICCSQVMNDAWVDEAESFFLKHYLSGVLQILETSSQIWSESNSFTLLHTTILSWGYYSNNISLGWV